MIQCGEAKLQSKDFEDGKIFFLIESGETKVEAYYRHLRNAFAHFNINHHGNFYYMKDYYPNSKIVTMIGKLMVEDLQQLCFLFSEQREKNKQLINLII